MYRFTIKFTDGWENRSEYEDHEPMPVPVDGKYVLKYGNGEVYICYERCVRSVNWEKIIPEQETPSPKKPEIVMHKEGAMVKDAEWWRFW